MKSRSLALLLMLSACGSSPPTRYHTLAAESPHQDAGAAPGSTLRVGEVNLPGTLDRGALVTRASPTRLVLSQQDRWAAPLDQMMQHVLTDDLTSRLPPGQVLAANDPSVPGTRTITLSVRQFIADSQGKVTLDADWTLQGSAPRHETVTAQASSADPDPVVTAMSQALAELADRIVADSIARHVRLPPSTS